MNENTAQLIEKLASKLGTTTEYLWSVLLKQAHVGIINNIYSVILVAIFGLIFYKFTKWVIKKLKEGSDTFEEYEAAIMIWGGIAVIVYIIIFFTTIFSTIPEIITQFANPEYWALEQVLETLKQD